MTTRVIRTEYDRQLLIQFIASRPTPFTVSIAKGAKRSTEQNRLQRLWVQEIAEQLGDRTPEEVRGEMKLHFGVPILRAEHAEFCAKYDAMVKPLPYEQKLALMMEPFDFGVTRLMTTKQKTQYLDEVFRFYSQQGLELTLPEDLGRAA